MVGWYSDGGWVLGWWAGTRMVGWYSDEGVGVGSGGWWWRVLAAVGG